MCAVQYLNTMPSTGGQRGLFVCCGGGGEMAYGDGGGNKNIMMIKISAWHFFV